MKFFNFVKSTNPLAWVVKLALCTVILFISEIFWSPGVWICTALACIFIALEFNPKSFIYVLYFIAFENVLLACFVVITACWGVVNFIKFVIQKPHASKKQYIILASGIILYVAYCLVTSRGYSFTTTNYYFESRGQQGTYFLLLLSSMFILFLCCFFKENIDFKSAVFACVAGLFASAVFGLFLEQRFISGDLTRFSAAMGNPNHFYVHILSALCAVIILDLKKQITWRSFVPMLAVLLALGIASISRMFILLLAVIVVLYIAIKILKEKKQCVKPIAIFIMTLVITSCFMSQYVLQSLDRMDMERIFATQVQTVSAESTINNDNIQRAGLVEILEKMDSGRTDIWRKNINDWKEGGWKNILFGTGIDAPDSYNMNQHSLYIFLLVKTGLVGICMFLLLIFAILFTLHKIKKYKFNTASLFILAVYAALSLTELYFPHFCGVLFLMFYILSLDKQKENKNDV